MKNILIGFMALGLSASAVASPTTAIMRALTPMKDLQTVKLAAEIEAITIDAQKAAAEGAQIIFDGNNSILFALQNYSMGGRGGIEGYRGIVFRVHSTALQTEESLTLMIHRAVEAFRNQHNGISVYTPAFDLAEDRQIITTLKTNGKGQEVLKYIIYFVQKELKNQGVLSGASAL